jgi:hypothetical protein
MKDVRYIKYRQKDWVTWIRRCLIERYIYGLFHLLLLSSSIQKPYSKLPYSRGNDSTVHTSADVRRYKPRFDLIRTTYFEKKRNIPYYSTTRIQATLRKHFINCLRGVTEVSENLSGAFKLLRRAYLKPKVDFRCVVLHDLIWIIELPVITHDHYSNAF